MMPNVAEADEILGKMIDLQPEDSQPEDSQPEDSQPEDLQPEDPRIRFVAGFMEWLDGEDGIWSKSPQFTSTARFKH